MHWYHHTYMGMKHNRWCTLLPAALPFFAHKFGRTSTKFSARLDQKVCTTELPQNKGKGLVYFLLSLSLT